MKKFICESCGGECYLALQAIAKNGDRICFGCETEYYAVCDCCHDLYHKDDLDIDVHDNWVCDSCKNDKGEYFICANCEEIIPLNEMSKLSNICNHCIKDAITS